MSEELPPRAVRRLLASAAELDAQDAEQLESRYRLIRELGRGGMGVVYEAEDRRLSRRVALKVLPDGEESAELRERFAREAQAAAGLSHPNIAAVYDATPRWIAMQLIEGRPLAESPREDRRRMVALIRDASRAVQHAHEHGIVHRDLKPSNLLVSGERVWIVDFGLAKSSADAGISVSGSILGTPAFMSPEQASGRHDAVDARTDVYGLGATLHFCLTGRPPFNEKEIVKLLRDVVEREPASPKVERDLDVIVLKCLAKEPSERFASAAELADDLERWLEGRPIRARAPTLAYRARKLVARHRRMVQATLAAVAVTAMVLVPASVSANAAKRAADTAKRAADAALVLSLRVSALLANAEAIRREGEMGRANERLDQGIRDCDAFLAQHDLARVHLLRGRLLRARGKREGAKADFDRALELEPGLAGVRFERGLLLVDVDPVQAQADLAELADLDRGDAIGTAEALGLREVDRRYGEAERARLRGDLAGARERLAEVLRLDPTHLDATLALARLAIANGDDDLALDLAISAVNLQRPAAADLGVTQKR